jgi:hypothetical protein
MLADNRVAAPRAEGPPAHDVARRAVARRVRRACRAAECVVTAELAQGPSVWFSESLQFGRGPGRRPRVAASAATVPGLLLGRAPLGDNRVAAPRAEGPPAHEVARRAVARGVRRACRAAECVVTAQLAQGPFVGRSDSVPGRVGGAAGEAQGDGTAACCGSAGLSAPLPPAGHPPPRLRTRGRE